MLHYEYNTKQPDTLEVTMMKRVANKTVAQAWTNGKSASKHQDTFFTDGHRIYSYDLCIGYTAVNGNKIALDFTARTGHFRSMTTSTKHVSAIIGRAHKVISPDEIGKVPVHLSEPRELR